MGGVGAVAVADDVRDVLWYFATLLLVLLIDLGNTMISDDTNNGRLENAFRGVENAATLYDGAVITSNSPPPLLRSTDERLFLLELGEFILLL